MLAKVFTIAIICVALGQGTATGSARDSSFSETTAYEEWIQGYRRGPLEMDIGGVRALGHHGPRAIVVITAIEGDDLKPDEQTAATFGRNYTVITHGCSVSAEGRVTYFQHSFNDSKGSGSSFPVIEGRDLERLKALLGKLPDDHSQLPAAGRRLVIQVPSGEQVLAKVYDRANIPEQVLEIMRLSQSGITSWALKFPPQNKWKLGAPAPCTYCAVAISPDGRQIVTVQSDGPISLWDAESHALVKSLRYYPMPLPGNFTASPALPHHLTFSPDGLTAIVGDYGDVDVRDSRTWEGIRKLRGDPLQPRLLHPRFTPDGRYLFVHSEQPALLIFDAKTWQQRDLLPRIPHDAVAYFPSNNGKRAIYVTGTRAIKLWNAQKLRDLAQLDGNGRIIDLAFAPDQSLVGVVIAHDNIQEKFSTVRDYRVGVWRTDDGQIFHELRPFEIPAYTVGDLHWWPDGKYLMAAISTAPMFGEQGIGLWDVKSGRFRGEFTGCGLTRFVIFPERQQVVGLCGNDSVAVWDGASAMDQIEQVPQFSSK